jgi:hypothetical protein
MTALRRIGGRLAGLPPLTSAAAIAVVLFALIGIGSPLLGRTVFAGTDQLSLFSPYLDSGQVTAPVQNMYMYDIWDSQLPSQELFSQSVRDGNPAWWNPYLSGGSPLGAVPSAATLSPLTLPYYVLPMWLAPAYAKLLEIAVSVLGCYLFLRRLSLRRPAAIIGGLAFSSSAFMVMWTNWPQTRVAAMIPWVFWAIERLVSRRRATDAVVLALPVAVMLLGGFPAVTAFTLMTAGAYVLVRVWPERWRAPSLGQWRRPARLILGGAAALVGAAALAAVQLIPFAAFYRTWLIEGREQNASEHLWLSTLATAFAPSTFGGARPDTQPVWYLGQNMVEASSFVGAAALVLAVTAVAMARSGRALLPRGVWLFFVAAAGAWLVLIYIGSPLRYLQELPVFSTNFIGRARSILGFLVAVLVAVGLELVLGRRTAAHRAEPARPRPRWAGPAWTWSAGVWAAFAAGVAVVAWSALRVAGDTDRVGAGGYAGRLSHAAEQITVGVVLIGLAAAVVAVTVWAAGTGRAWTPHARLGAGLVLVVLITGQALSYVVPYWPRVDRGSFYPVTDVHRFLQANLGHDRYVGTDTAMFVGVDAAKRLRALGGHEFVNHEFADLVRQVPGAPLDNPTMLLLQGSNVDQATSPVIDRLGGRYYVSSPRDPVFGLADRGSGDGTTVDLNPGQGVAVQVPGGGPLRAVGVTPTVDVAARDLDTTVEVELIGADGRSIASGRRLAAGMVAYGSFQVPVAAEDVPPGEQLRAMITVRGSSSIPVLATGGAPVVSTVRPAEDGLKLVYAGDSVIYERLRALPRIRWAARAAVEPDQAARLALLASGTVPADEVVLNTTNRATDGRPAEVTVLEDGVTAISVRVDAEGAGYLVVADALQAGWVATVDGAPAELVAADHGIVAVAVGAGTHHVELRYAAPYHGVGGWVTLAAAVCAMAVVVVDKRRRRPDNAEPAASAVLTYSGDVDRR